MIEIFFFACLVIIFYTYLGYGILLKILNAVKRKKQPPEPLIYTPTVTIIVPAYNEEAWLEEKIRNILELDYPQNRMEIIFITDGSTDGTARILSRYPSIIHLHEPKRRGKVAASNRAVSASTGEILIFSDANTFLNPAAVRKITRHYYDKQVGGVAGEKLVKAVDAGTAAKGEGIYWQYESFLKKEDSRFYSTMGAAGEIFSIRRNLYEHLPENTIIEDFVQSLRLCLKGYTVRYEPEAWATETGSATVGEEMKRKIRISAGAFQAMGMLRPLFNIFKFPALSFQFISHRILRWTITPLALVFLYLTNIWLVAKASGIFYEIFLFLQTLFYIVALIGWLLRSKRKTPRIFTIAFYFVFMNFSVFVGFYRFITNTQTVIWEKAKRENSASAFPK